MNETQERVKRTDRLERIRRRRVAQAHRLRGEDRSLLAIARIMGVSESTVRAYLKQSE